MHPITSNLWRSEDTRYTLGYRTGASVNAASAPAQEPDVQPGPSASPPDEIDRLITKLSRQLDS